MFLKSKIFNNKQSRMWLLLVGLFVMLPCFLFFIGRSSDFFQRSTCYDMTTGVIGLHIGLLLIIPLARLLSWKQICFIILLFLPAEIASFALYHPFGIKIIDGLMLIGAYHSIYLFGIKGLLEIWKFRKERRVILSIFLTSPLLVILGITAFVSFFFVINCF